MARETKDICLRELKESHKSRFDGYRVRNSGLIMLPFGIVACTFFLEIVVYVKLYKPIFYHAIVFI